ncbi:serine/threonine-protein kinase [Nocardia bovistercoris]|uniref:non-specific serine/threonine protein kinase n=1 Tax=Nocardia bovistercoris TaxID=2785916 RepID=A0A931N5M9_9NOCA|nr:serine/threonine protein kinase [Nocardia bovistercoris]
MGSALVPGRIFAGYRIERLLGAGGMGEVYLAHDRGLPRFVALKVLTRAVGEDEDAHRRFQREADMVARLSHPNIVTVHARGDEDGRPWISMAYVDGADLGAVLARGPMAPERAVRIALAAADALAHAHDVGVLHRDVKPANILLTRGPAERALLTDFGIAKHLEDSVVLTRTNEVYASFQYTAPERLDFGAPVDRRADVYSLGCTFYHMLTGEIPYPGGNAAQLMHGHLHRPAPRPSARNPLVPEAFDAVVARALAKDPEDRYPDCARFAADLEAASSGRAVVAPYRSAPLPAARPTEGYGVYPPTVSGESAADSTGGEVRARGRGPLGLRKPALVVGAVAAVGAGVLGLTAALEHGFPFGDSSVVIPAVEPLVGKWQGVAEQDDAGVLTRYRMTISLRSGPVGTVVGSTLYEVPGGNCSGELTLREEGEDGRAASYYEQIVSGPCIPNGTVAVTAAADDGLTFSYSGVTRAGAPERVTARLDRVG